MPPAAASSEPATTSSGARSPPSASTAMRVKLLAGEAERLDFAALVRAAGRADAVRLLRGAALRAGREARRLDRVRGAPLVAARLGGFPLRDCHSAGQSSRAGLLALPARPSGGRRFPRRG